MGGVFGTDLCGTETRIILDRNPVERDIEDEVNTFIRKNLSLEGNEETEEQIRVRLEKQYLRHSSVITSIGERKYESKDLDGPNVMFADDLKIVCCLSLDKFFTNAFTNLKVLEIRSDIGVFADHCVTRLPCAYNLEIMSLCIFDHFRLDKEKATRFNLFFQINEFSSLERLFITTYFNEGVENLGTLSLGSKWNVFPRLNVLSIISSLVSDTLFHQHRCIFPKLEKLGIKGDDDGKNFNMSGVGWNDANFQELKGLVLKNLNNLTDRVIVENEFPRLRSFCLREVPKVTLMGTFVQYNGKDVFIRDHEVKVVKDEVAEFLSRGRCITKKREEEEEGEEEDEDYF